LIDGLYIARLYLIFKIRLDMVVDSSDLLFAFGALLSDFFGEI
jgi:hypothetical protein